MRKRLTPMLILLLLIATVAYSVVNAANAALPERAERASCGALIASFCSVYGAAVCNAIVPQDCGAMQTSGTGREHRHERSIFYILTGILLGIVFVECLRRRGVLTVSHREDFARRFFSPNITSPPLLVGGLSSLRF